MNNVQSDKLSSDLETVRLIYAVHESAHAVIALKNNISVPMIKSADYGLFSVQVDLFSVLNLDIEDLLDLHIAGVVAVDLFSEFYGKEEWFDLIRDKHAADDMRVIDCLIKHYKKSKSQIGKGATRIKQEAYDRTYSYLEQRFASVLTLGCHLAVAGNLDSEEIARHFVEVDI